MCCCICCPSSFTPGIPARDYRCFPKIEPSLFFFSYYCLTRLRLLFLHAGPQTSARDGTEQCGETSQRWRCAAHHLRLYSLCLYSLKREERKKKDADYLFSLLLSFCYFFLSLFSFLFVWITSFQCAHGSFNLAFFRVFNTHKNTTDEDLYS